MCFQNMEELELSWPEWAEIHEKHFPQMELFKGINHARKTNHVLKPDGESDIVRRQDANPPGDSSSAESNQVR